MGKSNLSFIREHIRFLIYWLEHHVLKNADVFHTLIAFNIIHKNMKITMTLYDTITRG